MIDSHCHFDFAAFDEDRDIIWQRCRDIGIRRLIIPGTEPTQWEHAAQHSAQYEGIYSACGLHPWWINDKTTQNISTQIGVFCQQHQVVAIGECGLDKHINIDLSTQEHIFREHLKIACDLQLPLIIHVRSLHNEVIKLLKHFKPKARGVIHAFSGSEHIAREYWQLGFCLGVGGVISYERANKTRNALKAMPLEALLLETDAPDMPLAGFQGQRNSPEFLPDIAEHLAQLREQSYAQICLQTTTNCEQLFFSNGL